MNFKPILIGAALASAAGIAYADSPLWLRNPNISPDGKTIAFTYKGDIYSVPVSGGMARQMTTSQAYDTNPMWSPDGKSIAFQSTRNSGNNDIYVMPATGGTPRRVTTNSGRETLCAWVNDSTLLFFASQMGDPKSVAHPRVGQVYTVNAYNPKRPKLYAHINVGAADFDSKGRMVYQDRKGLENIFRKHERSSGTNDIWVKDGDKYTKLTDFNGHDSNPVWNGDGSITYVSEQDGTLNVWTMNGDGSGKKQLTKFTDHPVRSLSRADNGTMAFSWNGELYTLAPGGEPQKVNVSIISDDYDADLQKRLLTSGATYMVPSPDGKEVAFIARGDVYVTSVKYKTTKQITNTPGQERVVSFSPDGKTLVYDSERDGQWQIFTSKIKDPKEKDFTHCTETVEELLYSPASGKPAQQPAFSPDGKKVAFLEDRTILQVIDPKTKAVTTALDGKYNYSYSDGDVTFVWSPDSKWFLTSYIGIGGWNNQDIALVKADGTEVVDLTESGYSDANPRWAMGGRALTYETSRYGMKSHGSWGEQSDIVVMMLNGDAWDEFNRTEEEAAIAKEEKEETDKEKDGDSKKGKKDAKKKDKDKNKKDAKNDDEVKPLEFDLANRQYRTRRLTDLSGFIGDYWLNNDGTKLYYVMQNADGKYNLMERDIRDDETKVLVPGLSGGMEPDKKGEKLFVLSGNGMSVVSLSDGKKEDIEFEAPYDRHPSKEREYIYKHMLSQVADKFYDKNLHGVDWDMYGKNYERFLPYINNNYDFSEMLSEILGELNASHTGSGYRAPGAQWSTANLGAFFDEDYNGEGLKIVEVLPRGPLSAKKLNIKPGDIIMAIDGESIAPNADVNSMLERKANRNVLLTVKRTDGKTDRITVKPISGVSDLMYQRWVENNEKMVDSLSNGRIGYVHVEGMDSPSFREVYSKLLGKYRNREAVVVDTRWNGGGWLHNDIALLLSGKKYVDYSPRGQYVGSDPFSQWTKPSVMLVNEANYSDAHGTPYTYQTLKIGDVVGAPIPGTMTAVWWETQVDPSIYFGIPQVTSLDRNGKALENHQLDPDVLIYNNPGDVERGKDAQIEGAVKDLLKKLDNKTK